MIMRDRDVADLYFQKAESNRHTALNFWTTGVIGLLIMLATLFFNSNFPGFIESTTNKFVFVVVVILLVGIILLLNHFLMMQYDEYKSNYVMYYSAIELKKYAASQNKTVSELTLDDVKYIIKMIHENFFFDVETITGSIRGYIDMMTRH